MQLRYRGARIALIGLVAVLLAAAPGQPALRAGAQGARGRYIVTLDAPPLGADAAPFALQVVEERRDETLAAMASLVGAPLTPIYVYRHALNGFAVELTAKQAAQVAALPGVAGVAPETFSTYQTDRGPSLIGVADRGQRPGLFFAPLAGAVGAAGRAVASYDASTQRLLLQLGYSGLGGDATAAELRLGAAGEAGALVESLGASMAGAQSGGGAYAGLLAPLDAAGEAALFAGRLFVRIEGPAGSIRGQLRPGGGEGVVVGVLDGGINVGHPFFQDPAPGGYDHINPRGAGSYVGVCSPDDGDGRYDPTFPCNDKLIGAYTFAETLGFPDPQGRPSPRDDDGHGSHTTSTLAGNVITSAPGGTLTGVAPHANLIIYDVCGTAAGPSSCSSLGIIAAIDQAIADRVDVINYSIGRTSTSPWGNVVAQAFLSAVEAGIVVSAAAGNAGPGPGTMGSPANAPWVLGVAAASLDRSFVNSLGGFSGGSEATRPGSLTGAGVSPPLAARTLVDAAVLSPPNGACADFTAAQAAQVAGKIVVCDDPFGFASAAPNVWAAGAAGAVFVAGVAAGPAFPQIIFSRPAVLLSAASGAALRRWLSGCAGCGAAIGGATLALDRPGDVIAGFSSRGPDLSVAGVLKPDVAAPGVAVLAASADYDPASADFEIISGTSMAAPHASGLAAILRQIHPDWTPSEVKSAMMLTAHPSMRKEDGSSAADPFDMGAGRITGAAALAGFVLDEGAAAYRAADPAAGGDPVGLNLASIATDECLGVCTFTRTLRSTLATTATWAIGREDGDGFTLSTSPAGSIILGPGARGTLVVTATATASISATYGFGRLTFTAPASLAPAVGLPVAIRTLRSTLEDPLEIRVVEPGGIVRVPVRSLGASGLTAGAYGLVRLTAQTLSLPEDPTPGSLDDGPEGIYTRTLALPPGTARLRAEIRRSQAPDMDLFVLADTDGNETQESLCAGVSIGNVERCDIPADDLIRGSAAPLTVTIMVQNFQGSGAAIDRVELLYGFVGTASAGNLAVSAPGSVRAGQPYDLSLGYSLGRARPGDSYIGVLTLSSSPDSADRGDLGAVPVTLHYVGHELRLPVVGR